MTQEPVLVGRRELLPEQLRVRTQRVHHRTPVEPQVGRPADLAAYGATERGERTAVLGVKPETVPAWDRGVGMRQEAPPGQSVDRSGKAFLQQREADVDHGQAGADQQDGPAGRQIAHRARMPGVAVIGLPLPPFGREVAQRQHRGIGAMNPSAGGLEQKAVVGRAQRGRLIVDQVQVAPTAQARDQSASRCVM